MFENWSIPAVHVRSNPGTSAHSNPSATATGAIVLGGDCGALGVARSLGRQGIAVLFLSSGNPLAAWSRYARHLRWPGADHAGATGWLIDLARRRGLDGWLLIPCGDAEVRLVAQHHAELAAVFRLCTPSWDITRWAADKNLTYQKAAEIGIDFPRTYEVTHADQLAALGCRFPIILKPAVKQGRNALTSSKAWQVDDEAGLRRRFDEALTLAGSGGLIVQELIPGGGASQFSYAAVCKDGEPVLSMVARRARQYPSDFGTGCYVETVEDATLEALAERFIRAIGYSGMVEMEFKRDDRDGAYKLLDVNPRVWTWNALGQVAGVDFPLTMWNVAGGRAVPRRRAPAGVAWMYVSRDLPVVLRAMLAGDLSVRDYLSAFRRPLGFATFAADDPLPALADLPLVLLRRLRPER
ncbi:MAG: ATP-grasp domain-containing protein [Xanthobacteraceae bacterium]|nr:MAG: ATP-grasp domain-containing protein [Xanthobacteraceae bacterium]